MGTIWSLYKIIQQGIERYEFNKMSQFQSLIPMVHLTFQIAKSLNSRPPTKNRIEPSYRKALKNCMQRTLWNVQVMILTPASEF